MNPETHARGELARPVPELAELVPAVEATRIALTPRAIPVGSPQIPPAAITPMGLLRALRRRSALALGVGLLVAAIAGPAAWFLVPVTFKAQARLQIAARPPKVLFQTVETQNMGGDDYTRYQSTQQTLVKSQLVLAAALRDPKVAKSQLIHKQVAPVEWLQEKIGVEFVSGSEVMEISMSGSNPEEVAAIVNAVKKAYMDEVVNVDLRRRTERFDHLKRIRDSYSELLKKKRQTMRKLAEEVGSDDRQTLALRQQYAMEHLHYLQKELLDVRSQRRKADAEFKLLQARETNETTAPPPQLSEELIARLVEEHPAVADLTVQLAQRQKQLNSAWANVRRLSRNPLAEPSIRALSDTVSGLRQSLARRRQEVRPAVIRMAQQQGVVEKDTEGQDLGHELAMLSDLEQRLEDEIKSISGVNQSLTVNTLDLQSNQDEVLQMELASTKVAEEVEALTVELDAPPRIRLIDDATLPRSGDSKKRFMMVGMITFGSFFGSIFGIAFLELQTGKVDSADEVPIELGLSVVGALPILPARRHQRGLSTQRESEKDRYWRNLLLESVDATRTMLLHTARSGAHQVLMITSAVGGEGKTSLASYLATSLARSGVRTLLIDADLRRPMMHQLFDQAQVPGLSELLRGEAVLDEVLAATAVPGLTLLPAGRFDGQALRSLSQRGLAPQFDCLKQQFDLIIVDTSPLLPVADAMLIAQNADAALFSIFRDVSRKDKVKAACERLQRLGVPVLGAVVTGGHGGGYGSNYYGSDASYPAVPDEAAAPSGPGS